MSINKILAGMMIFIASAATAFAGIVANTTSPSADAGWNYEIVAGTASVGMNGGTVPNEESYDDLLATLWEEDPKEPPQELWIKSQLATLEEEEMEYSPAPFFAAAEEIVTEPSYGEIIALEEEDDTPMTEMASLPPFKPESWLVAETADSGISWSYTPYLMEGAREDIFESFPSLVNLPTREVTTA